MSYPMPNTSSSNNNSASEDKHEVFISFRGDDTRNNFTSHLNAALRRLDIRTYMDQQDLRRGDEIPERLLRAIKEANLSVIVFSENFASSKWCLDEVVSIIKYKKKKGQIVVPVFYRIDPSVVRNQIGSYGDAFAKHVKRFQGSNMEKVQQWREVLTEAANHSGWECNLNRAESDVVEEIAMDVLEKLNRVHVSDLDHEIKKLEQLAELQLQYCKVFNSIENHMVHQTTLQRIAQVQIERKFRMLRMTPDMLSFMNK